MNPTSTTAIGVATSRPQPTRTKTIIRNLPIRDLLGNRAQYLSICVPLYNASIKGDWEAAQAILDKHQDLDLVGYAISENYDTALHIAASAKSSKLIENFVENLVDKMTKEQLELKNDNDNTAFCLAAAGGNVKTVMTMLEKNGNLGDITGSNGMMPLYMASLFGKHEMVNYLYKNSREMHGDSWTNKNRSWVLQKCVEADQYVSRWPLLAKSGILLGVLARKPDAFRGIKPHFIWRIICPILALIHVKVGPSEKETDAMELLKIIWSEIVKLSKDEINSIIRGPADQPTNSGTEKEDVEQLLGSILENVAKMPNRIHNLWSRKPVDHEAKSVNQKFSSRVLFVAAEMGNTEFLVELIRQYPDLIWKKNDNEQTIFHVAISHRHEGIYNLLHEIGSMKDMITPLKDLKGNNMLHLVGKCAKKKRLQVISGVALQMQRELLWFKEVEGMIPPSYRERKNNDGLTPHELFSKEHKELLASGEKWMKETASQSMVVAALIATIVFAAAFTVPGGYNQTNGVPMFFQKRSFIVFVISDAISLTFSSVSLLIFLSILTSRYAEDDFLELLPKRLMRGLTTLFFSIAAMMVAFSVSFFVLYQNNLIWIPIVISAIASVPVFLYARLQYDLLGDVYNSTYTSKNLFKPEKLKIYYQNPKH
ncbi:uncharacterized protein LOC111903468 isoform X2 [Lactuca sativa]|uniref:uncharacterized protein LOC111903468 isoform X2 n=1 Tax=Lactuca sativa TaxID=4236 RepID=UPI0022B070FA|nr:uncharacterized protein LOC111903468 isoform X2 [Lactuca sativa]